MSDINKINKLFGTKLSDNQPADKASVQKAKGSTQSEVTQKQRNTYYVTAQNELANKKLNPLSNRSYANKEVKTKKGTGNKVQGAAN